MLVMGILNVTPDSFADGGLHFDTELAISHGREMIEDGVDIIDIGGESTRPGADRVSADEEQARVIPVIRELITNAIRHADANAIDLVVLANQTYCEIRVVDDGKGYIPGERKSGLLNLERRALARGGEFEILGNTVSGTRTMWRVSL